MGAEKSNAKPKRETANTEKQGGKPQKVKAAPLPVVESAHSKAKGRNAEEAKDKTDREQDEALDSIADQTVWMERQTKWMEEQVRWTRNQFWAALALGVFTLFVLAYQSVTMSGQLEAMNSGSAQTQEMIAAMQKQAKATEQTAEISAQTFAIGERPYVIFKGLKVKLVEGSPPVIDGFVTNMGRTPAYHLEVETTFTLQSAPLTERLKYVESATPSLYDVFLPTNSDMVVSDQAPFIITKQRLEAINKQQILLCFYGKGHYTDGLGKSQHSVEFCYFYNVPTESLLQCPMSVRPQ
jgi:hypothetical protein